jgi:hypothetical protein
VSKVCYFFPMASYGPPFDSDTNYLELDAQANCGRN